MDAIAELRSRLRDDGTALVLERSYADWEQLPATAQRQLQITGVLPRFTDSRPEKSTADIELSLDVLHAVLTRLSSFMSRSLEETETTCPSCAA
jgi:hypothetical protein